jgi:hypothetical protein
VDHIVNFNAVHKLCIIAHFCLNAVKLSVKLFQVREGPKVHILSIITDMFVLEEELDDLLSQIDFIDTCGWLLEPFFHQTGAYLCFALV